MSRTVFRLDQLLVDQGRFPSRSQAKAAVMAGVVYVDGRRVDKAGTLVAEDASIVIQAPDNPYVSRGGLKLEGALDHFNISPRDRVCLDVGASTGGFTDCLLQRGARTVYAVDVGYGQLAWKLRQHPAVRVMERTNFRDVSPGTFTDVTLVTIDVSFISILKVLPALEGNVETNGDVVGLIKPQFEAGRRAVSKGGGVIRDPGVHETVLRSTMDGARRFGWVPVNITHSPVQGPKGNIEFFCWWRLADTQDEVFVNDERIPSIVQKAHRFF